MIKRKISRKTRAQAALICDVAASTAFISTGQIASSIGASKEAVDLSYAAWHFVWHQPGHSWRAAEAEAAQLIREGWSP